MWADTIDFTYSGSGFSGAGNFTATDRHDGSWLVTAVNGEQNGIAFSGVEPLGTNPSYIYDNLVFLNSAPQLDLDGVLLSWNGGDVNLGFDSGLNGGSYARWSPGESAITFKASATPEPGTFVMLGSGVLGLAGLIRRKLSL
jgi:hypothetical protein